MALFRCIGSSGGGSTPIRLPYNPDDSDYTLSYSTLLGFKAAIDAYNTANSVTAIDWNNANVIVVVTYALMWDDYVSMTNIKQTNFYIYSSNTVATSFSSGKNFSNFEIDDSACTITINDGSYAHYTVYKRRMGAGNRYAGWNVDYESSGVLYKTYFGDRTLVQVESTGEEGDFSYIPNYPLWVSKSFTTTDSQGQTGNFLSKTMQNCQIAQGSFTSPSVADETITIDCGFEPDFLKVLMEFGNSQTTAYYFKTGNEDNEEISVWDLRPTEGAIYQIFDPSGTVTNETGICEITATGFKYKAHGSNTTSKACTYQALKFQDGSTPKFDEDAFYQNGTWLHPEDMTMLVTGGSVDASGNLYFDSTTDICGVSTDDLIDEGKYKYIFFVRNMSNSTLTAQFGSCTPGYTTQQIIGTGQGRGAYASASVAPNNRGVFVYDINHAGGSAGVFAGMYPTNNPWQIEKILRIPIT